MSIDRAKKGAPPVPAVAPAPAVNPLERLHRGEVDLDGYLDLKLHEATAHLAGLRPAELEEIRSVLRERVAQDPALAEIVRRATGEVPRPKGHRE
jgi:hypothetical protein